MSYISVITDEWHFFFKDLKYYAYAYIVEHIPVKVKVTI